MSFVLTGGLDAITADKKEKVVIAPDAISVSGGSVSTTPPASAGIADGTNATVGASAPDNTTPDAVNENSPKAINADDKNAQENTDDLMPLNGAVIGLDAGHQLHGNNAKEAMAPDDSTMKPKVTSGTSGVNSGIPEHELNLAVALKLQKLLEKEGATVIMVRTADDVDISNQERASMMNEAGADLVIRIHANGGGPSEKGAMMLVPDGHIPNDIEAESRKAGEIIFASYISETGATDLGVIPRSDMTGFNWSKVPVCLIEMGFMTNKIEDNLLATDEYRNKCAKGLAIGITKWYAVDD